MKVVGKIIAMYYYLLFPVVLGLLVYSVYTNVTANHRLEDLTKQNTQLSTDIKTLATQNKQLAAENKAYTKCIANVFAKYTQDRQPVIIEDLEKCVTSSLTQTNPQPPGTNPPASNSPTPDTSSPAVLDTSGQPAVAPTPPQPNVIQRTLNNVQSAVRGLFN